FERGARIKSPAELLARAAPLLMADAPDAWRSLALSGTAVAQQAVPMLDLLGTPRLDLVAQLPRTARSFDPDVLRLLDDGLEPEPNVLAPAPVVVTLVRAGIGFECEAGAGTPRCAHPCDVFLALLDLGLREQAVHYATGVRA